MLYVSLIGSALLLLATNVMIYYKRPVFEVLGVTVPVALVSMCGVFVLPTFLLHSALLCVALLVLLVPNRGRRLFLPASLVATLIAYGITGYFAYERYQKQERLRDEYVFESIEDRLPPRPPAGQAAPADPKRLNEMEQAIGIELRDDRVFNLQRLHERNVDEFVNSPGFGVGRLRTLDNYEGYYKRGYREPIPEPGIGLDLSPPDVWNPVTVPHADEFHTHSVVDFTHPGGFGWVKDRQNVAGFQQHGFSKVPGGPGANWKVGTIDLVGLLLHETPRAYISANLPRMEELRDAPTRDLDPFEAEGLKELQGGQDLFIRGSERQVRMLGAIRATKQCLTCHGGDRGDLLGAFSYSLRKSE